MKHIWNYFLYVLRHKWFVYQECRALGLGFWQSFKHDWTKLLPSEFIPYMNKFNRKLTGDDHQRAFDIAWLHHIHWNPHHWQHHILHNDRDGVKVLRMPEKYVKEMVADWRGVGMALGKGRENAVGWYLDNKDTLALHPQTRSRVETLLSIKIPDRYVQVVPPPIPREPGS
jgi:hypothetical protein